MKRSVQNPLSEHPHPINEYTDNKELCHYPIYFVQHIAPERPTVCNTIKFYSHFTWSYKEWGIGIFFLHDTNGRALQANRAGPNWPNPSSPFLLMSTGNTKALPFLQCKKKMRMPHSISTEHGTNECTTLVEKSERQKRLEDVVKFIDLLKSKNHILTGSEWASQCHLHLK